MGNRRGKPVDGLAVRTGAQDKVYLQRGSANTMVTLGVGDGAIVANLPHFFEFFSIIIWKQFTN